MPRPDRQDSATPTVWSIAGDLLRLTARVIRLAVGGLSRRELAIIASTGAEIVADVIELAGSAKED